MLIYVTADDGEQELVAAILRPGNVGAGHRLVNILRRVVERLREAFPGSEIIFRGDGGMAYPEVYEYLEEARLKYMISLPKNERLLRLSDRIMGEARKRYKENGKEKVREFGEVWYRAESWGKSVV